MQALLTSVAQRLHESSELPVWASLGASWGQAGSIQSSYDSAMQHYEQLLMGADRQVAVALPVAGGEAGTGAPTIPTVVLPDVEGFTMKLIDGNAEAIERHILDVLDAPPDQALLERQPYVNAAIALMLAIQEMAGGEDYSELFMPIPQLATLDELRQHVLAQASSLRERQDRERQGQTGQAYSPHVAFLLEQVERHYAEDMSLKTLSQTLDIHPTYLGQLFHQELGTSFSDYVNHYRIEKATQLLLRTELKTSDIAREVGYLDSSYFYRQFKKYAGLSPTELRSMSSRA
ncbi:putative DNA-binding response regulator [Paenibacillus sp. 598K]|nr:putative DNA-binding response regulator [Paenibacillus sp. 598K]